MFTLPRAFVTALTALSLVTSSAYAVGHPPLLTPTETTQFTILTGTILGAEGQPRPGVCVFPVADRRLIAVTDAHGTFKLQVPDAPMQHLQAEYVGLGSTRFDIDGQHPQPVRIVLGQ
jgi:hypothetical protein